MLSIILLWSDKKLLANAGLLCPVASSSVAVAKRRSLRRATSYRAPATPAARAAAAAASRAEASGAGAAHAAPVDGWDARAEAWAAERGYVAERRRARHGAELRCWTVGWQRPAVVAGPTGAAVACGCPARRSQAAAAARTFVTGSCEGSSRPVAAAASASSGADVFGGGAAPKIDAPDPGRKLDVVVSATLPSSKRRRGPGETVSRWRATTRFHSWPTGEVMPEPRSGVRRSSLPERLGKSIWRNWKLAPSPWIAGCDALGALHKVLVVAVRGADKLLCLTTRLLCGEGTSCT